MESQEKEDFEKALAALRIHCQQCGATWIRKTANPVRCARCGKPLPVEKEGTIPAKGQVPTPTVTGRRSHGSLAES